MDLKTISFVLQRGAAIPGALFELYGTKIPRPLRLGVTSLSDEFHRPKLTVACKSALFGPEGAVFVQLPRWRSPRRVFEKKTVIEIRTERGDGEIIKERNHDYCVNCGSLTGNMESHTEGAVAGCVNGLYVCANCGFAWTLGNV